MREDITVMFEPHEWPAATALHVLLQASAARAKKLQGRILRKC